MITTAFAELYQQVRENALSGACTVAILVAPDVDALCAVRILCAMLRSDGVNYSLIPVSGYTQVSAIFQRWSETSHDIRSVFLVNCGAIVNLANLLPWDGPQLTCYVIDSHRPVHLANVYERERVWVLRGEEEEGEEDVPSDGDGLSGDEETSDEEEEEEQEGEEREGSEVASEEEMDLDDVGDRQWAGSGGEDELEDEEEGEGRRRKRRIIEEDEEEGDEGARADDEGEEEEKEEGEEEKEEDGEKVEGEGEGRKEGEEQVEEDDDDDDSLMSVGEKDKRKKKKEKKRKQGHEGAGEGLKETTVRRRRIRQYYNGSFYGSPSAFVMHRLAQEIAKETRDSLWLAIVGLTDMLLQQRLDHDQYVSMATSLEIEVNLSNSRRPDFQAADGTIIPASEAGRLEAEMELKLMLYRHWSLYESMYHSNYVASRLQVWRSFGKLRMEELFAKMGFSLAQCKEKFKFMDPGLRQRLRAELERHQPDYGLNEIFFLSFLRYYGYRSPVSASDIVFSVGALLDVGPGTNPSSLPSHALSAEDETALLTSRFHDALEALGSAQEAKVMEGIDLAMGMQQALFRLAVSLLDKREIKGVKHFRYGVIHNNVGSAEDRLFTHPLALGKLAIFLVDVDREMGKAPARARTWKARPLVLLAERANTYLVVGVTCPDRLGEVKRNRFGQAFRYAAEQIQARYRHDGFDSAVMEIDKGDMQRFVESLHLTMDA